MFQFKSIRTKLLVFLLISITLPMMTSIVISYIYTKDTVTKESIRTNDNLLSLGKTNILNYMNNVNQQSLSIYSGINVSNSIYTIVDQGRHDYASNRNVYMQLLNLLQSIKDFYQIHLYAVKGQTSHFITRESMNHEINTNFRFPRNSDRQFQPFVEPTHPSGIYGISDPFSKIKSDAVITFHRPVIRTPYDQVMGFLSIDFKVDTLYTICKQLYDPGSEKLYIIDQENAFVYSPDRKQWGGKAEYPWIAKLRQTSLDSGHFEWNGERFSGIISYNKITTGYMDWILVKQIPYDYLYANARNITRINALVVGLFLIAVILSAIYISFHFTNPIKKLLGYIYKIEIGNMNVNIDIGSQDELGMLARRFKEMMRTINNLIRREYRLELLNKSNQLKALQAQINPHFMNNALQSIGTLALQHRNSQVYELISYLGKMMRYNMDTKETIVPLLREIEYAQAYFNLQKRRFAEDLDFDLKVEESVKGIMIPKMILQPLVENYFKHGMDARLDNPHIWLTCEWADTGTNLLRICVEDNGTGCTDEQLEHLKQGMHRHISGDSQAEGIGLANVLARLNLYFNDEVTIDIEHLQPHGFKVTLWIHINQGGEQN